MVKEGEVRICLWCGLSYSGSYHDRVCPVRATNVLREEGNMEQKTRLDEDLEKDRIMADTLNSAFKTRYTEDNWKVRGEKMVCLSCMYFVEKFRLPSEEKPTLGLAIGRCRRHAPTMSGWPVMFLTDWCGDHKLDENKV